MWSGRGIHESGVRRGPGERIQKLCDFQFATSEHGVGRRRAEHVKVVIEQFAQRSFKLRGIIEFVRPSGPGALVPYPAPATTGHPGVESHVRRTLAGPRLRGAGAALVCICQGGCG